MVPLIDQGQRQMKAKNARKTEIEEETNMPRSGSVHTLLILIQCDDIEKVAELDAMRINNELENVKERETFR